MTRFNDLLVLAIVLATTTTLCSGDPCGAGSTVWTVDDDAGADFYYIQDAIDAASDGDEILVYPGTYTDTGDNVVDMMGKAVWLHSSDGSETTIIDGEDVRRGIACVTAETSKTVIEGFTVTRGSTVNFLNGANNNGAGMICENSSPTLTNCVFTENNTIAYGHNGGGLAIHSGSPSLTDCVIDGNTSATAGGGMFNTNSSPTLTNCTIRNNASLAGTGGGGMRNGLGSNPTLTNCIIENNTAATSGGGIQNNDSSYPTLTDTVVCGNTPDQISGAWTDGGGNTVADTCSSAPTGACCIDTSCSIGTDADCSAAGGTYLGDGSSCSGDPCGAGSTVWTVDDDAGADFYYIQDAVDAALDGDEILVYPGTYTDTGANVVDMMGKAVWLHSSDGPETTIIDGEDVRRGIICTSGETNATAIEGFTIKNGYADSLSGYRYGGGMYNLNSSSPTLTDCTFTNNTAYNGGGMYNRQSSPTLTDCTFENNTSDTYGGGMRNYNNSSPTLTNCTFTNNTTGTDSYGGGGMANTSFSSPTLIDCTFANNTTETLGGGLINNETSVPTLTGTTVCGNSPDQINGAWTDNGGNCIADECTDTDEDGIPDACELATGDLNLDGCIDGADLAMLLAVWGSTTPPFGDLNNDGLVDGGDLLILLGAWGGCGG